MNSSLPYRDFIGYGRNVPRIEWPDGARIAVSIVVNYEEGSEYSLLDGDDQHETNNEVPSPVPPGQRDLFNESFFEYGSRVGVILAKSNRARPKAFAPYGWSLSNAHRILGTTLLAVFPTRVGVILSYAYQHSVNLRLPHTDGGYPIFLNRRLSSCIKSLSV